MTKQERLLKNLHEEQRPDGSFGRFHSMDSKRRQKITTTQSAAWLMYDNAFTRQDEVCNKTCVYMERLLSDLSLWPDAWEKNRWFRPAVPLFIASSLALFGSDDKKYMDVRDTWIDLLTSVFKAGDYSASAANACAKSSLGVDIDGSYIGFHSINTLALYALNSQLIPRDIQRAYLQWLHRFDGAIGYTTIRPDSLANNPEAARVLSLLTKFDGFEDEFSEICGGA